MKTTPPIIDKEQLLAILKKAADEADSHTKWAEDHGMSKAYLSDVLAMNRGPGKKILDALGYVEERLYRKISYKGKSGGK